VESSRLKSRYLWLYYLGLEAVVVARLSYLIERFSLLPTNHFGGRLRRSAEHTLNVLVERIY
jgi:hypothetical protein